MNKKNQKMLMFLCIALVAVCAVYIIVTNIAKAKTAKEEAEAAAKDEAARVFVTDMSDIKTLTLNTGEAELTFVKDGETWQYKEDDKFPANQSSLTSIADALQKFEADRKLEGGDALSDYGFGEDNIYVTAADGEGNEKTIIYGDAVGDGYYVKAADEDTVYTADSLVYGQFQGKTLYDFVDAETLPTTFSDSITQVKLEIAGETYVYDRPKEETDESNAAENESAAESVTESESGSEPESETKSPKEEAFDNLSAAIPGMSIEKCADYYADKDELKKYGLDKPQMTIEYTYTDSDDNEKTQVIYVGGKAEKEDTENDAYYIRLDGSDMVNTMSAASVDGLKGYVKK